MSEEGRLVEELQSIKFVLVLSNSDKIDSYLNEVITTTIRRKIWTLVDGERSPTDLANDGGVSGAAITKFLNTVSEAGLVKYVKGNPPKRVIDYTPAVWMKEIEEAEAIQQKVKEPGIKEPESKP
jgi:DNA-binding MarR family transcriptional regulator